MKRIRNSRAARLLSWFLTWVMVMPILTGVIAPRPVSAQATQPTPASNMLTAIVIDFGNKTGIGGEGLARFATDAVAVELASSQRFEVLRREEVLRAAETLGYRAPYDKSQLARLAQQLSATAIITGDVAFAEVYDKRGQEKVVEVGMEVRVMDPTSNELINGARQLGSAVAKPGFSDTDALAQEAAQKAAASAVRNIVSYTLPTGIVLNTVGSGETLQVLINRGSRDGVESGQEMIVLREGVRVGRIRVTNVFPTDSEAKVIDLGLGVRPTDAVRAVFPLPRVDWKRGGAPSGGAKRTGNPLSQIGKFLLVIGVVILVATAMKGGSSVTGVTAEADVINGSPAVRIKWRDNLFGTNAQEYHIWRQPDAPFNFQGTPVGAVQLSREYVDFAAPFSFWDGVRGFLQAPFNTGNNQQGGGLAAIVTPALGAVAGFIVGRTATYQVSAIVRRTSTLNTGGNQGGGGGQQQTLEDVETNPVTSGPTTPINPPLLDLPRDVAANVNIGNPNTPGVGTLSFSWLTRAGADTYVVEVSPDPSFQNRNLIQQFGPFFTTSTAEGIVMTIPQLQNLTTSAILRRDPTFAAFVNRVPGAARPTLFWRIGARNNADQPGPVHWFSKNNKDSDRTFRFIYSQVRSFTPADLPPPPP